MSMNHKLLCFIFVFISSSVFGQAFEKAASLSQQGFDPARMARIDNIINKSIRDGEIPGAVALILRKGKIVLYNKYGYADIGTKKKMELDAIFRIASMTKPITVAGVMILYERGYFLLNDPVSEILPEFKNPRILVDADSLGNVIKTVPAKNEIRIIDLLTHTSGLSYPFMPGDLQKVYKKNGIIDAVTAGDFELKDQMKKLAALPLLFEPGSKYQYGLNMDVLGYLIEKVSGKSLQQFFQDEIFNPLKMVNSGFYVPQNKSERLVTLYSWVEGKGLVVSKGDESGITLDNPKFPVEGAKKYYSGGGGLTSTVNDYGRFVQMLLNNGELDGARLLSRKTVELIRSRRTDNNNDGVPDAGIGGINIISDLGKRAELGSIDEYSGTGAFYGQYWIDPREEMAIVFMSQVLPAGNTRIAAKFHNMVYQALK